MSAFFAYLYYRVCKVFFKWDGIDGNRAIWAVTTIQTLIICDFALVIFIFFGGSRAALFSYSKMIAVSVVVVSIILMIVNGRKYDGRYDELDSRWKDEPENKKIFNGFLLILSMMLPWVGLFLISRLK